MAERECIYCGEQARKRVVPLEGAELYICDEHEERAIVELGSGYIEDLRPAIRVINGGRA